MYKLLVLGVVSSLVISNVVGMVLIDDPSSETMGMRVREEVPTRDYWTDYDTDESSEELALPTIEKRFYYQMPKFPEVVAENKPEDEPDDKPEDKLEDKPEDKPDNKPEDKPEDKPQYEPENKPQYEPKDKSEENPEAPSEDNLNDLKNSLDNIVVKLADLITISAKNRLTDLSESTINAVKELRSEYLVTKGIGAHKLHLRRLSWNKARKVCIDEGGQLADIRSDSEEKILLQMLVEKNVEFAWLGYHDIFEEGDWVSVLGEPLGKSGWDRWWEIGLPNPDNLGDEDCACLMRDGGGMNDNKCSTELPFICKITAL